MSPHRRNPTRVIGGEALMRRIYTRIGCDGRPPQFHVEFFPYSSLTITVRKRQEVVYARFSDLLRRAPLDVLEAAAALILARLYRRIAPRSLVQPYLQYVRSKRTRGRLHKMRSRRVRPLRTVPQGQHHDLEILFDALNWQYFGGALQRPRIGWSERAWRRQFGSYDPGPNQIVLNRRMDRPGVQRFVVEYVLFHEMLHVKHPTRRSGCTLLSHSPEFRAEEKCFPCFAAARRFLDRLAR